MTASTKPDVAETLRELHSRRTICDGGNGNVYDVADDACENAVSIIESLQAELAKARQSIQKFGHHTASCAWSLRGGACNCGWFDVSRAGRAFQGVKQDGKARQT